MYYVYLLLSKVKQRQIYIGFTNNLDKRIKQHNQNKVFSTKLSAFIINGYPRLSVF
jgi:predicted GIY-YIG superfamily endonuclease